MKALLLLLSTILLVSACTKECDRVFFEDQKFMEESKSFHAFTNFERAIYVDASGKEYTYEVETNINQNSNYFISIDCNGETKEAGYSGEKILVRLIGPDSTIIAFSHNIDFLAGETELKEDRLADILTISVFSNIFGLEVTLARMRIITSDRGGTVDQNTLNRSQFVITDSLDVQGKTYEQVYEQNPFFLDPIFYNKALGVVAFFNKNDTMLVLDRLE